MNIFFFLGQTFFEQSISISKEIKSQYPEAQFRAIVAARSNLMDELYALTDPKFSNYDWLSALEQKWLDTPLDIKKIKEYEKKLGTKALRRIITADREVGVGFVSCGNVESTKLMELCKDDDLRWRYVVGLLDYFFNEFESNRPDAVFVYCVAGAVAFAMGEVTSYLNIPFTQPVMARVKHYHIMDDNNYWLLNSVSELFNKSLQDDSLVASKIPEAKEFIKEFRDKPLSPQDTLTWIKEIKKKNTLKGIIKTSTIDIFRWVAIKLSLKGTRGVLRQRSGLDILKFNLRIFWNLRKTLKGSIKEFVNDVGDWEYLYFPLHVDPEASTMVLADMFTDQMAVIESIAKSMPAGMRLVVKEHIPCVGKRPKGFYERINAMPDVRIVSPFMNNFELIKNAKLVCTITGTAGWESLLLGKPPLVIGDVYYLSIKDGLVHCQDLSKIGDAIKSAIDMKPVSSEILEKYIATIITLGIDISPEDMWFEKYADMEKRKKSVRAMAEHLIYIALKNKDNAAVKLKKVNQYS